MNDARPGEDSAGGADEELDPRPSRSEATPSQSSASLEEAMQRSLNVPQVLPEYRILKLLGRGGFGEVWLAEHKIDGKLAAIKFFAHGAGRDWELLLSEVKRLALLAGDPGIVQVYDVAPDSDPPYYVMRYAEGGSLAARIGELGPLPPARALRIFRQLAEALAYVHVKGVRHCDLKPANILMDIRGRALIADFGQAHLSSGTSAALGTFFYMAPEQAEARDQIPDTRWDVYGLGAIAFEMLTGLPPRFDETVRDVVNQTEDLGHKLEHYRAWFGRAAKPVEHHQVAGVDGDLARIIDGCLEVDPANRWQDAGDILAALDRRERRIQRRWALVQGLVPALILLLLGSVVSVVEGTKAISQAYYGLTDQLLASDRALARLLADVVEREVQIREKAVGEGAAQRELVTALTRRDDAAMTALLRQLAATRPDLNFTRWSIADANGVLRAQLTRDEQGGDWKAEGAFVGENFAWREWFNGDRDRTEGQRAKPLEKLRMSRPFRSKATLDSPSVFGSTISAPIRAEPDGRVIGVLAAKIPMTKIYYWLNDVIIRGGFPVLIDKNCVIQYHPNLELYAPGPHEPRSCPFRSLIHEQNDTSTEHQYDPIEGKERLAGCALARTIGWGVLVEHDPKVALAPVEKMEHQMAYFGLLTLILIIALMGVLGWYFDWMLRRKERPVDA